MAQRHEIKAVRDELTAWIEQQRNADVLAAARNVRLGLEAATIGANAPSRAMCSLIAEDVAKLAALTGDQ
jgi:hypothetical protein